ncbi:S8 family peptidase [Streptomyces sp. NPDC002623]
MTLHLSGNYGESTWNLLAHRSWIWIDVAFLATLIFFHTLAQFSDDTQASDDDRHTASTRLGSASTAGITVVGILAPLTVLAIQLSAGSPRLKLPDSAIIDFLAANIWLATSLTLGLWVLYLTAFKATSGNVLNKRSVTCPFGYQLFFLAVGVERFLWGILNASINGRGGEVDIAAPGWNVRSAALDGGYRVMNGTSMATAHVAGVLALLAQANPNASAADLIARLKSGAFPLIQPVGDVGAGLLQAP